MATTDVALQKEQKAELETLNKGISDLIKSVKEGNEIAAKDNSMVGKANEQFKEFGSNLGDMADRLNPLKQLSAGIDSLKGSLKMPELPEAVTNPMGAIKGAFGKLMEPKATKEEIANNEIAEKQLGKLEELAEDNISILSELQDQSKKLGQLTTVETDTDVSDQIKIEPIQEGPQSSLLEAPESMEDGFLMVAEQVEDMKNLFTAEGIYHDNFFGQNGVLGVLKSIDDRQERLALRDDPQVTQVMGDSGVPQGPDEGVTGSVPKALKGLGGLGKGFGDLIGGIVGGIGDGFAKVGRSFKNVALGALAIGLVGAALIPSAKAFQMFSEVSWKAVGIGVTVLLALVGAVALIGAIMTSGVGAVAILAGAGALAILGAAMIPAAKGFEIFGKALNEHLAPAIQKILPALSEFIDKLGDTIVKIVEGIGNAIADTIDRLVRSVGQLGTELTRYNDIDAGNMLKLGPALISLAAGLTALTAGGLLSSVGGGLAKLFSFGKAKSPFEKLEDLGKAGPGILDAANGVDLLGTAMTRLSIAAKSFSGDEIRKNLEKTIKAIAKGLKEIDGKKLKSLNEALEVLMPEVNTGFQMDASQGQVREGELALAGQAGMNALNAPVTNNNQTTTTSTNVFGRGDQVNRTKRAVMTARPIYA